MQGRLLFVLFLVTPAFAGGVLDDLRKSDLNDYAIGAGIGYNIYLMNLDSSDEGLRGSLKLRHHGPIVFISFRF